MGHEGGLCGSPSHGHWPTRADHCMVLHVVMKSASPVKNILATHVKEIRKDPLHGIVDESGQVFFCKWHVVLHFLNTQM